MTAVRSKSTSSSVRPFVFESFGVVVKIDGNMQEMVDEAAGIARHSLLNCLDDADGKTVNQLFEIKRTKSHYYLTLNGECIAVGRAKKKFFKFFDSILRVTVGENAPSRVFVHAGAVGWKGKGIVMPADSFKGKSTLVAELVRQGAEYYSDDFAILDESGLLYPFPRNLSMRTEDGTWPYEITAESLGGQAAAGPLPVRLVLLTEYQADEQWSPKTLTAGNGVLEMIPFVLSLRRHPELSMRALNSIASRAIITRSRRGAATETAESILNFVDKNVN